MALANQISDVVLLVLDAVPGRHLDDDGLVSPKADGERALGAVQALDGSVPRAVLVGRLVNVEDGVHVVAHEIVVRVEDVVVVAVGEDVVGGDHVVRLVEVVHVGAERARREALGEEDLAVVAGEEGRLEAGDAALVAGFSLRVVQRCASVAYASIQPLSSNWNTKIICSSSEVARIKLVFF